MSSLARWGACLLCAGTAMAQTTWVVDDNGAGDFVHIQDAVDVAQDGDVLHVLSGAYAAFTIDGKALVVVGEPGGDVQVAATVIVRNLASSQQVELDNLRFGVTFFTVQTATVECIDNAGPVRIVDCEVLGAGRSDRTAYDPDVCALRCRDSEGVVVLRSTLRGRGAGGYYAYDGSHGLYASGSRVVVTESTIVGANGNSSSHPIILCGGRGGIGAYLRGGSTIVSLASSLEGGVWGTTLQGLACPWPRQSGVVLASGSTGTWKATTVNGSVPSGNDAFAATQIAAFCFGTWEECPCGNHGAGLAGCDNAFGTGGVELTATGNASVSGDTVEIRATGLNPGAAPTTIFFQGTKAIANGVGAPFTDGLLCAGGAVQRLKGKSAVNGTVVLGHGEPSDQPISVQGALPPEGGTRIYQLWYRNAPAMFCPPSAFNMSNALEITWEP